MIDQRKSKCKLIIQKCAAQLSSNCHKGAYFFLAVPYNLEKCNFEQKKRDLIINDFFFNIYEDFVILFWGGMCTMQVQL